MNEATPARCGFGELYYDGYSLLLHRFFPKTELPVDETWLLMLYCSLKNSSFVARCWFSIFHRTTFELFFNSYLSPINCIITHRASARLK